MITFCSIHRHAYDPAECTVVSLAEGGHGVLDHSIQTLIAKGTKDECRLWIMDEVERRYDLWLMSHEKW